MTDEQKEALGKAATVMYSLGYYAESRKIGALLAAGASEGKEPVAYLRKDKYGNFDTVDSHIYGAFPVYAKPCTCHPDDNPPIPCAKQYALRECRSVADERRK